MAVIALYAFAAGLVLLCVCERVLNTFLWLFSSASRKKGRASEAYQVCGGVLGVGVSFASCVASALVRIATVSLTGLFWLLLLFLFVAILSTTYSDFPGVWLNAVDYYNARVGPFVHGYLLFPVQLFSLCFRGLVPIFNSFVWIARVVTTQGLLPILFDEVRLLINIGVAFMQLGTHFANSCFSFVGAAQCPNAACLLNPPELDLVTPMGDLRTVAVLSTGLVSEICSVMAIPVDLLLYPLLDVNLARTVHHAANAWLQLFVVVPIVTERRCTLFGSLGMPADTLMCTPDFEPVFTRVVAAVRTFGQLLDNWLAVAFGISQRTLTGIPELCPEPVALGPDTFRAGLLQGETAVVGLTEWTLAATNATVAYFYGAGHDGIAPRAWPIPIDPSLGVAAVSYGEVRGDGGARVGAAQTTTLFGCTCLDTTGGLVIRCAFLPLSGTISVADATLDVWFQDATWVADLSCATVEISVRSVRWPVRRYEGMVAAFGPTTTALPTTDCTTRGTCESVDATIWLVPKCSLLPAALCDAALTVGTSCFPFCMAARIGGARNANPVLVNARTWREGKQLLGRDCVLHDTGTASPSSTLPGGGVGVGTAFVGGTAFSGLAGGSNFATGPASGALDCRVGINTLLSLVPKPDGEYQLPFVRMAGQPFAIAGDTLLLEDPQPDGGTMVQVERLTGNQRDVFTLQRTFNDLPAAPKRLVPADEFAFDPRKTLVVPYEYEATRIHSTSSRNYVFYAVSPAMQIFSAFLSYCSDPDSLPQFQFVILSSYGPLRIYRVRAYCERLSLCPDISSKVDLDGFLVNGTVFEPNCTRRYNATIDGLEYVNEQNIAVVVQVADHTFDPKKLRGNGSQYVTYWLNPQTMALQAGKMWRGEAASTQDGTAVCLTPAIPLPRLGALAAELANVAVFLGRFVVVGVASAPGLVVQWRAAGGTCPLAARGHSAIASCGRDVYSLDDMHDSVEDASLTFWGIIGFAANLIASTPAAQVLPLTDILRGTAAVGAATVSVYEVSGGAVGLLKTPIPAQVEALFGVVTGRTRMQSVSHLAVSGAAWSRFSTRVLFVLATDVVIALCSVPGITISALNHIFKNGLYDQRAAFQAIVSDRAEAGCEGVRIIFGGDNPWADVLYHLCMSSANFMNGAYDFGMSVFVEAPMVKCMCKDAAGHNVRTYGTELCAPATPTTLRPTLLSIIALQSDNALLCPDVIGFVRASMEGTLEPWFGDMYKLLDALGSSVDYALIGFDDDAGQCLNFADNSNVVVILPAPIDYFQACGMTSDCHSKCAAEWAAFLEAKSAYDASQLAGTAVMTQTVESLFFPTTTGDMVVPSPLVAIAQPDTYCGVVCRSGSDQCVAVSYPSAAVSGRYAVRYFCIPSAPSEGTYAGTDASAWDFSVGASDSVESAEFLWTNGTAMVLQVLGGGGTRLQIVSKDPSVGRVPLNVTPSDSGCVPVLQSLGLRSIRIVDFLSMGLAGYLLVNVAVRVSVDGNFNSDVYALWIDPWAPSVRVASIPPDLWRGYTASEFPDHSSTTTTFIFWPKATGVPQRVVFDWSYSTPTVQQVPMQLSTTLAAKASLVPQNLLLSKNLVNSQEYYLMFASRGSTYDWLAQLRLTRSGMTLLAAHVVNSQPITSAVTVRTGCDGTDCRACPASLRSMCAVYQSCAVFRCIGTPVNLQRPLCGIGLALRSAGMIYVQTMHGAWTMFVELFMLLLQLSTQRQLSGINLAFPSENFFGHVCAVKDLSAEVISILASTVNGALQLAQVPDARLQMAASVDSGSNAVMAMSTMAVTSFLNQICLFPVYLMVIGHKIMTCDVSGWIAVVGHDGVSVTLQQAGFASAEASMVGSCLTVNAQIQAQQTGDASVAHMIGTTAAALVTNAAQRMIMTRLEPIMHMFDGIMAYLMGIVGKFGSMLQAFDLRHCVLPDVTLSQALQCACGDTALKIPASRASETAADFGLWCSGTLSLTDASNAQVLVYNPYSYAQLRTMLRGAMDTYIQCASSSFQCTPPNDDVFAMQGVSLIPVFTRCRQNYVNRAWDPAAYALFDQNVLNRAVPQAVAPLAADPLAGGGVGSCLLENAAKGGAGGGACLDAYMQSKGLTEAYWAYEPLSALFANTGQKPGDILASGGPLEGAFINLFLNAVGLPAVGDIIALYMVNTMGTGTAASLLTFLRLNGLQTVAAWANTINGANLFFFVRVTIPRDSSVIYSELNQFYGNSGLHYDRHWAEVPVTDISSSDVDACTVFSGPAGNQAVSVQRRAKFQSCLNGYSTGLSCDLSGFVWSPASGNDVPVASRHVVSGNYLSQSVVTERYAAAHKLVMDQLNALGTYSNQRLNVAFFSAEGDLLHQLLDCVFMGPYSRVDYWPQHRCTPSSPADCLVGPYWSRDDGAGASRKIDSEHCSATAELPFTCGSPMRKSMTHYFVQQYLLRGVGGADLIRQQINRWLTELRTTWMDQYQYGCECAGQDGARSAFCCSLADDSPIPDSLKRDILYLNTTNVLMGIEARMQDFYGDFKHLHTPYTTNMDPSELAKYDWASSPGAHWVENEARYDTTAPQMRYDRQEAQSPPREGDGSLWYACHGAMRQVLFTMPVTADGTLRDPVVAFGGGGPDAIAAQVEALVQAAYESSPLYRHYVVRHHPSASTVCEQQQASATASGAVNFSSFAADGFTVFDGSQATPQPVHGAAYAPLGAWGSRCFCGWQATATGGCVAPPAACQALSLGSASCTYSLARQDRAALAALFRSDTWPCPELALSEHMGFLDGAATEAWLRGGLDLTTSGDSILRYGVGGLMAGNLPGLSRLSQNASLDAVLRAHLTPGARAVDPQLGVLTGCAFDSQLDQKKLVDGFVEGLFPMAQGIADSATVSYCLRYAIELARLRALELSTMAAGTNQSHAEVVRQKGVVGTWMRRCGSQVQLVAMCQALDIFHVYPLARRCMLPFTVLSLVDDPREVYTTPECLVFIDGAFYDPCGCHPEWCTGPVTTVLYPADLTASCALRFDPRGVVREAELAWWPGDLGDPALATLAAGANAWLAQPWNLLDLEAFVAQALASPQGTGNVPTGQSWQDAEGFMNETGQFCDMISDYWPDEAPFPVGYHVTTPCSSADAAYRTFDNVFAREGDWLTYYEDQTRDGESIGSRFGAGGLCSGVNFGFDMFETNTMRICTRLSDQEDDDIHVPASSGGAADSYSTEACSTSSSQLPWAGASDYDFYDQAFYNVGTVPHLPHATDTIYPTVSAPLWVLGPADRIRTEGWGAACQDLELPVCGTTGGWSCPSGFRCLHGVCMQNEVQCTQHADCAGGRMCSGVGTCVQPRVVVQNWLDTNVSFKGHTTACPGASFSMVGASPWGYVPDILLAHGMCSYRHWQEYLATLAKQGCSTSASTTCSINDTATPVYAFDQASSPPASVWWDPNSNYPNRLKVIPVTCDRDYERFMMGGVELKACIPSPGNATIRLSSGAVLYSFDRERVLRTHEPSRIVTLGTMPFATNTTWGFLGSNTPLILRSCGQFHQCYADVFTQNGAASMTIKNGLSVPNRVLADSTQYDARNIFQCGFPGYSTGSSCVVDAKLFPLYGILCLGTVPDSCAAIIDNTKPVMQRLSSLCNIINKPYSPTVSFIEDTLVPALSGLFQVFIQPTTVIQHLHAVDCVNHIYSTISSPPYTSKALYFPFTFTAYEFPVSWFYQCILGSGLSPDIKARQTYTCPYQGAVAPVRPATYIQQTGASDSFEDYIRFVRAGYTAASLTAYAAAQASAAQAQWRTCAAQTITTLYGPVDASVPMCYQESRWILDPATYDFNLRMIISTKAFPVCAAALAAASLDKYNNAHQTNYLMSTIMPLLAQNTGTPVAQNKGAQTLLSIITDYGMGVLEQAKAFDRLVTTPVTATNRYPVSYNNAVPTAASDMAQLIASLAQNQGYQPASDSVTPSFNCTPAGKTTGIPTVQLFNDAYDQMMGRSTRVCPIYRQGTLGCAYPPITVDGTVFTASNQDLLTGNWPQVFGRYFQQIVAKVSTCYTQSTQSPPRAIPDALPFFEEEYALSFPKPFSFDLTAVRAFQNNINPDPTAPVMCVLGNQTIDYTKCTDKNYAFLKAHVRSNFVRDGPVVVPSMAQLTWAVTSDMLSNGSIFSYASTARNLSHQYVWSLLDDTTSCGADMSPDQRVCRFSSVGALASASVVAPWLDGLWNPFDQCDVAQTDINTGYTENIDASCSYPDACPPGNFLVGYFTNMPNAQSCIANQGKKTSQLNIDKATAYNLCTQRVVQDQICMHEEGMVGGTDGVPTFDYKKGDIYTLNELYDLPTGLDAGLFGNPLFSGQAQDYGLLRVPQGHIAGDTIGLRIQKDPSMTLGSMQVAKIPLKPVAAEYTAMDAWESQTVDQWVSGLASSFAADDAVYRQQLASASQAFAWDCPLRRRAYYGNSVPGFGPSLPSARRSQRLFYNVTGGAYAHPTQLRSSASAYFGEYSTTNGFCFCPTSVARDTPDGICSVAIRNQTTHPCSLWNTIRAVSGVAWGASFAFPLRTSDYMVKTCSMQLDWPYVGGNLRDGSTLLDPETSSTVWAKASDPEGHRCHVLDRMRPISYTYRSVNELRPSGRTTLDAGVCHTGRAQSGFPGAAGRCIRLAKTAAGASMTCESNAAFTAARRSSTKPPAAASNAAFGRQRCGQCSAPPKFRTRGGAALPPQSSFGLPYRLSAERALAKDLVRALCPEAGIAAADCAARLNASSWQPGVFLPTYLTAPRRLLRPVQDASTPIADAFLPVSAPPPDEALWAHPWVYCPSRDALRTGSCNGSIPKALWRARKVQSCHAAIDDALQGQPDPMGKTSVCNMDSALSSLCAAIEEAKTLIAGANCLASGNPKCAVQEFVYTPSTWEATNQKFVHQTVLDYYRLADNGICPVTDDVAALIAQNAAIVKNCAANPVFAFYAVIQAVRNIVDTIVQTLSHAISLVFQLCLTLVTTSRNNAQAQAIADWHELKRLTASATGTLSDLVVDLAFTSGTAGPWIRYVMGEACALSNKAYRYFADVYCTLVVTALPSMLLGVKSLGTWMRVGFQVLNDFMSVILERFLPKAYVELLKRGYSKGFQAADYQATQALYAPQVDPKSKVAKQPMPLSEVEREVANPPTDSAVVNNLGKDMEKDVNADVDTKNNVVSDAEKNAVNSAAATAEKDVATSATSSLAINAGRVLMAVQIAQMGFSLLQGMQDVQDIAAAFQNYPNMWTVFDYTVFFRVIDDMMKFIQSDLTCFSTIKQNPLPCNFLGLAELNVTAADAMAPAASQCWAEAQERQVGVTTLYACTAASTCLESPTASRVVLCATCPANTNALFHTYGCNTMLQLCQCGTQALDVTGCVAHRDCAAPAAACSVLAALGDISFGTVACSACSSPPICLLDSSLRGRCTCLSTGTSELDICSVAAGQPTIPSPSRLCGYAYDPSAYYFWGDLALLMCVNVHAGVCAEVTSDSIGTFFMTVASQSPASQQGRRLLVAPDRAPPSAIQRRREGFAAWPAWNHTAEPCAGIALALAAGDALGPVDSAAADMCLFWRSAARMVISAHNLTELEPFDHFLLSMEDFANALHQRGVLQTFLSHPEALLEAILHTPLLQPLRVLHRILLHHSHHKAWFSPHATNGSQGNASEAANASEGSQEWNDTSRAPRRRLLHAQPNPASSAPRRRLLHAQPNPASRRPLSVLSDAVASLEASPAFRPFAEAAKRITIPAVPARLSVLYAQSSLRGPFAWQRAYFTGLCPPVQAVAVAIARSMAVVHTYYARFAEIAAQPAPPFRIFPDFTAPANWTAGALRSASAAASTGSAKTFSAWAFESALALVGMAPRDLAFLLSDPCGGEDCTSRNRVTLLYALDTALSCDFEAVMYCNLHSRDLLSSCLFAVVVYCVLAVIGSATGLTILPTLFFMASPAFILWYSFGLSIGCMPMIPTCFIDSFIASASAALPLNISLPALLLDCAPAPCLRSCSELGFATWADPLVFFACSLGLGPLLQDYIADVAVKQAMAASPDVAAYAVCAVVSSASSVPFLMLAGSLLTALWALVTLFLDLIPASAALLWHVVAYSHAREGEAELD